MKNVHVLILTLILSSTLLTACGSWRTATHNHPMAPLTEMPVEVQRASFKVQEGYQFSVANPEAAKAIPCYCGCAGMGHASSYDCYVSGTNEDGSLEFDVHAQSCTICVDITRDTMHMLDEGKGIDEIFAIIEAEYAQFGPPTIAENGGDS